MRKEKQWKGLLASLLVTAVLLCSFPGLSEEAADAEIPAEEMTAEAPQKTQEEAPSDREQAPEPEPESEPVFVPAPDPEPEKAAVAEKPASEPEAASVPEDKPAEEPETEKEEEPAQEAAEEEPEDKLYEFDDDDAGYVSDELTDRFNNPEAGEKAVFTGTADIEIKESEIAFGRDVTLVARVSGAEGLNYRLVWEANDGDGRGWYAVGTGPEYIFRLTHENAEREYRVALLTVD